MPFDGSKPGPGSEKGNKNHTRKRIWTDALRKVVIQDKRGLEAMARALFERAIEGDIVAIKEIGDRLEGKAIQAVDLNVDNRTAQRNMGDSQLLEILTENSSSGTTSEKSSEGESDVVH